ncbi:hypothetical protein A2U01_0040970, partial [Trifolium medium]|nr:hypothetical protein [Trifolium medium]
MSGMHDVFHVSQLRKFVPDSSVTVDLELIDLEPNMTFQPQPVQIVDRDVRKLSNRSIPVVRVIWEGSPEGEATWELETGLVAERPMARSGELRQRKRLNFQDMFAER